MPFSCRPSVLFRFRVEKLQRHNKTAQNDLREPIEGQRVQGHSWLTFDLRLPRLDARQRQAVHSGGIPTRYCTV